VRVDYLLRRLAYLVPSVLGAVTLVFVIVRLAPGDPLHVILGDFRDTASPATIAAIRQQYGLDRPLYEQYLIYVLNMLRGNFGTSLASGQPVLDTVVPHIRPTLMLAAGGLIVAVLSGVPAGIAAALRRNSLFDYALMSSAVVWLSAPGFWFAILLIYAFGFKLPWFPMFGGGEAGNLRSELYYLVLPSIAIGARSAALLARMSRSSTLEVLSQDYIRTARAKGLAERVVVYKHLLRNAAIPIVTIIGLDLAYLMGGAVVMETVFARPGLGKTMVDAIGNRDYPVVQGCIILFAVAVIVVNFLTDFAYSLIDRRLTFE
jgi:peptide/nickel transport system permease protein